MVWHKWALCDLALACLNIYSDPRKNTVARYLELFFLYIHNIMAGQDHILSTRIVYSLLKAMGLKGQRHGCNLLKVKFMADTETLCIMSLSGPSSDVNHNLL